MDPTLSFYDNLTGLEGYLNLPSGSLRQIPIYARKAAVDAILKVRELEKQSIFRPGLYYIVLADLCSNTDFGVKYGDAECDLRTQWFHTAVVETIGNLQPRNYIAFNKTIGDASLLIFSSFQDVFDWSQQLDKNLEALSEDYVISIEERNFFADRSDEEREKLVQAFKLRARRFAHMGEISYKENADPLCLSVSQTFKIEKNFSELDLGCTQAVAEAIRPKLNEMGVKLFENREVCMPGMKEPVMTYYVRR